MSSLMRSLVSLSLATAASACVTATETVDIQISGTGRVGLLLACSDQANDAACMELAEADLAEGRRAGAFDAVRIACVRGHQPACTQLFAIAESGEVLQDSARRAESFPLLVDGCERLVAIACWLVALSLLLDGKSNAASLAAFFETACRSGDSKSCALESVMLLSDPSLDPAGLRYTRLQEACGRLLPEACIAIGEGALSGVKLGGPFEEPSPSMDLLACALGSGGSCTDAGYWLSQQGLSADAERDLYAQGCRLGSSVGCNNLAVVTADPAEQQEYFRLSCSQGYAPACALVN